MRILYFDLDGTLVSGLLGEVKPRLAGGAFERAVRRAGFERLVCVANLVDIVRSLAALGREVDGPGMILELAPGAFEDEAWFRSVIELVPEPQERARFVDTSLDWWWVDDLAGRYIQRAGRGAELGPHLGGRILVTAGEGSGQDVLDWLGRMPPPPG